MIFGKEPMLAAKADFAKIRYPILASPKLDGIRAIVVNGRLLTRKLKEVPNLYIFNLLSNPMYEGWDGELIVGPPTSKSCYRDTVSGVMSHDGEPNFKFYVFDIWNRKYGWTGPLTSMPVWSCPHAIALNHEMMESQSDIDNYEAIQLELGYEGIILRDPNGPYKFGRSTVNEGYLLKVKRFEDSEAVIIGMEEEMFNGNEATRDERGFTHRTSHGANKFGKNRLGALVVKDTTTGVESRIGTGFSAAERDWFWKTNPIGQIVKYRFLAYGVKDKPRHSSYLGLRPEGA